MFSQPHHRWPSTSNSRPVILVELEQGGVEREYMTERRLAVPKLLAEQRVVVARGRRFRPAEPVVLGMSDPPLDAALDHADIGPGRRDEFRSATLD